MTSPSGGVRPREAGSGGHTGALNMLTFGLTFVRHGETQYNKDKLLQGQGIDTPLSKVGLRQAEAVGHYLREVHFTNVFVSNLQRATQTAAVILRNNIHSSGIEMVLDPLLRERGFGVAEGRTKEELRNMAHASGQACKDFTPPGGETVEQVKARFRKFLKSLFQRMLDDHSSKPPNCCHAPLDLCLPEPAGQADDGVTNLATHALVVSHGAYIRAAVRHLVEDLQCSLPVGMKMNQVYSACPNTGICRFIVTLGARESNPRPTAIYCVFINRKDHLSDLDSD